MFLASGPNRHTVGRSFLPRSLFPAPGRSAANLSDRSRGRTQRSVFPTNPRPRPRNARPFCSLSSGCCGTVPYHLTGRSRVPFLAEKSKTAPCTPPFVFPPLWEYGANFCVIRSCLCRPLRSNPKYPSRPVFVFVIILPRPVPSRVLQLVYTPSRVLVLQLVRFVCVCTGNQTFIFCATMMLLFVRVYCECFRFDRYHPALLMMMMTEG